MRILILKEKKECYLTRSRESLTYHHIIPKREFEYNNDENILVLNRTAHNIIDCPDCRRTEKFYLENKKLIDKYNDYLKENTFEDKHLWDVLKQEIKKKPARGIKGKAKDYQKKSKQYKKYMLKKELEKSKLKNKKKKKIGLTPFGKRKLLEKK